MTLLQPSDRPLSVTYLILPESSLMSVASALDPLRAANRMARRTLFTWQIASFDGGPLRTTCGVEVPADLRLSAAAGGDLLVVVGGFNHDRHVGKPERLMLRRCARRYGALAAVETGSWVLARAGLLDNRSATIHWETQEDFQAAFPFVEVKPDRFVVDGEILTAGGASPTFDLMLHIIRARYGYPLALEVASAFIYEGTKTAAEAQHLVALGRLSGDEPRVAEAIRLMESHLDEPLPVAAIARRLGMSVRTLDSLFQRALGSTPGRFYLRLRLQAARRLVLDTRLPMQEIALRAGFGSLAAFSRSFKASFRVSPRHYRQAALGEGPGALGSR